MGNVSGKQGGILSRDLVASRPKLVQEEVAHLPLVRHYVYAVLAEHVYNNPNRRPLPPGWRVLLTCADFNLAREGFYAVAYIHEKFRHCIISFRGTSEVLGLRAGIWIYFDEPTIQVALAEQFSKCVHLHIKMVLSDADEYVVSYTGHSLGAVLATCRACVEHTFAVTFESPGCKSFIEKTMHPFKADDGDIITYLRPPNPINSLRPQCGYLVQIPIDEKSIVSLDNPRAGAEGQAKLRFLNIPSAQDYFRRNLIAGIPQLQQYINQVEPVLREMMEHTQQVHSIHSIASHFEKEDEPPNEHVILVWPSHLMQFLEYYNTSKALEDPGNNTGQARAAYESLQSRLCITAQRPKESIPLRFLNKNTQKLVRWWWRLDPQSLSYLPFSEMDHKVLNTTYIEGESLCSSVLTAFQVKQYINLLLARTNIEVFLDTYCADVESKL